MTTTSNGTDVQNFNLPVQDLTAFSIGNVSLTSSQITATILTGKPTEEGRNLYLPIAGSDLAGRFLIIKNRSDTYSFIVWGGLAKISSIDPLDAVLIACDGYNWFVV